MNPIAQSFIAGIWFQAGMFRLFTYIDTPDHPTATAIIVTIGLFAVWWYWKLLGKWHVRRPEDTP